MGATAGTGMGVQRFAEGGSTSSGGFGGINPAAIRADSRAFGIGPAAQSLQRDLAREQMQNQRQIYRPEYVDYGLGATPQARGYLGSIIGNDLPMMMYQNRMPTFTRPSAPMAQQASYNIPMGGQQSNLPLRATRGLFGIKSATPEQQSANLIRDYRGSNLTEARYNTMMQNPEMYLDFLQRVEAGENPTSIGYAAPPPVRYMTAAQQQAYNQNLANQLESMIAPRTTFNMQDTAGSAGN